MDLSALDEHGEALKEFKPQTLKGNSVSQPAAWDLLGLAGKSIRLRFEISSGRPWSFRFSK